MRLLFFLLITNVCLGQDAKSSFDSANVYLESKQYSQALSKLNYCEKTLRSSNALIENLKVKCYFELGEYDKAEKSLQKFFKYKAADYLIDEMLEYAGKIRNEKIRLIKNEMKAFQNEMIDTHSKLDEIVQKEEKTITNNISSINEEIQRIEKELVLQDFKKADSINTIEALEAHVVRYPNSRFKVQVEEKVDALKIIQTQDKKLLEDYFNQHYNSRYSEFIRDSLIALVKRNRYTDHREQLNNSEEFSIISDMPYFPGGSEALSRYISSNLNYPEDAIAKNISGKVYVGFIVNKDGTVSNVEIKRGIGGSCDEEALRIIREMPTWVPGMQRGELIRVRQVVPITFRLVD